MCDGGNLVHPSGAALEEVAEHSCSSSLCCRRGKLADHSLLTHFHYFVGGKAAVGVDDCFPSVSNSATPNTKRGKFHTTEHSLKAIQIFLYTSQKCGMLLFVEYWAYAPSHKAK